MPQYYFDTFDGDRISQDDEGLELEGIDAARNEARKALPDMARDTIPDDGDCRVLSVKVRDETGKVVVTATLSLVVTVET